MHAAATNVRQFLATFLASELRAWRGETSLGFVFWVYGVACSSLLAALTFRSFIRSEWNLLQILIVVSFAYTVWVLVAVWRCSARATLFWGGLTRWLTIAWGLNTILVLSFVEIELAACYVSD